MSVTSTDAPHDSDSHTASEPGNEVLAPVGHRPIPASAPVSVLVRAGEVRVEERPVPTPGPGEVLVEVRAVGICGSDVHYFTDGRIGDYVVTDPLVLGHEASGVVVAHGPGADRLALGQRVALEPGVPCGRCVPCRTGRYNLCPDVKFFATPPYDGAFAHYVVLDQDFAHPVPDSLDDEQAALIEPLSVGVWACRAGDVRLGDRVLVTGAGPIGLLAAQVARAAGASHVVVTDVSPARRELAQRLGAHEVLDPRDGPLAGRVEADVLLECSGVPAAVTDALHAVAPGGRAVLVGMAAAAESPLPVQVIQNREIALTGTFRYANVYPTAIELAASGAVDLSSLVTGRFGLHQVEQALRAGHDDPGSIKPVVLPWLEDSDSE